MIKVLLVDDNAIMRRATKQFLPEDGFILVVGECSDGRDVLGVLNNMEVDVILMDITMKYIAGIEATKLVKKKYPTIKVIAFSNHIDKLYKEEMALAGADNYIVKGAEIENIRKVIKLTVVEDS